MNFIFAYIYIFFPESPLCLSTQTTSSKFLNDSRRVKEILLSLYTATCYEYFKLILN